MGEGKCLTPRTAISLREPSQVIRPHHRREEEKHTIRQLQLAPRVCKCVVQRNNYALRLLIHQHRMAANKLRLAYTPREQTHAPMAEGSPPNVLPCNTYIAPLKHQRAECQRLRTRPVNPLAALNTPKTVLHVSVQPWMYFLRRVQALCMYKHRQRIALTNPPGTCTLALPTSLSTVLLTPVSC